MQSLSLEVSRGVPLSAAEGISVFLVTETQTLSSAVRVVCH
jgi:hypothetical protein